ncbi:glutaredoxin domain-containing protein [Priestia megaterium]
MNKLIVLSQNGCNPCAMVKGHLNDLGVKFKEINLSINPAKGGEYGVMSAPVTILLDENDQEIKRSIGFKGYELEEMIAQL